MAKKRRKTEAQLDLENIRKLKRLTKRVYAGLEAMEKWLLKVDRMDWTLRQSTPTSEEVEAAMELYSQPVRGPITR